MARSPPLESSYQRHPRSTETHPLENGHYHQSQTLSERYQHTEQQQQFALRHRHGHRAERISPGDNTNNTLLDEPAEWAEDGTILQLQAQDLLEDDVNVLVTYLLGTTNSDFASSTTLNAWNGSPVSDCSGNGTNDHNMQRWAQQTRSDEPWTFRDGSSQAPECESPYSHEPSTGYLATPRTLTISHEDLMGLADVAHEYNYHGWTQPYQNEMSGLMDDEAAGDITTSND